jgi:rRNA maturation protein Nop10
MWWARIEKAVGTPVMSDYGHALALELAVKHDKRDLAKKLAAELRKRAKKSGDHVYWTTAGFSRWGDNTVEVTAMVMKALVAYNADDPLIPGVLAYFHATKRGDRWDSTKDTACVLYALCDYLAAVRAGAPAAGLVKIAVNGVEDGTATLDSPVSKVVKLSGKTLKPGENVIKVTGPGEVGGALARVVVSFTRGRAADIPARDHGVKVVRTLSLRNADGTWTELKSGATVPTGSYVKVRVVATPAPGVDVRYTLLESPKPAGGETVPADDPRFRPAERAYVLREDREAFTAFHYEEVRGAFAAEYVVLTEFAGEFRTAPARVELMYKPAVGGHSDSFVLKVAEKK